MAKGDERLAGLADALATGLAGGGHPPLSVRAAVALALDFWTWQRLAKEGLEDGPAARVMAAAARAAAGI